MAENILTVDLDMLRGFADRVERRAAVLKALPPHGLTPSDLPGSDTVTAAGPQRLADLFDPVVQALIRWAADAHAAAAAFGHGEHENAGRLTGR